MSRGGKREGAGKHKGTLWPSTILKREMRDALIKRAHDEMNALYDAQFALALGHWRVIDDPVTGQPIRVYKKPPNGEALGYLLDQVIDRAVQHVDVDGKLETEDKVSPETLAAIKQAFVYAIPKAAKTKRGSNPSPDRK